MPIISHQRLHCPDKSETLWRYMNLSKFKNLLETSQLYFTRLDKFEDPHEGVFPARNFDPQTPTKVHQVDVIFGFDETSGKITLEPHKYVKQIPLGEFHKKDFDKYVKEAKERNLRLSKEIFASCWHKNVTESAQFWQTYRFDEPMVAIKTSVFDLQSAVTDKAFIYSSEVQYYDEGEAIPFDNNFFAAIYKRRQFESEKEVRLLFWSEEPINKNRVEGECFRAQVDLRKLVKEIWLSPYCSEQHTKEINCIVSKLSWDVQVSESTVFRKPKF